MPDTRSKCPRSQPDDSETQSEGEIEMIKRQLAERERQLKEQARSLSNQQDELYRKQKILEETKNSDAGTSNLNAILSAIQKDLSSLKHLPEQFHVLEQRVNNVQSIVCDSDKETLVPNQSLQQNMNLDRTLISIIDSPEGGPSHLKVPDSNPAFNSQTNLSNPLPYNATNYSNSAIRDTLEFVPRFDGHNMPVLQFARACKRAKELTPLTNENHLVRLLRNKLTGHAYLAVEDEIHDTVDRFIDSLKRTFGPARNSNYYRGQLSINFKKSSEHILDYIGRVKDLRNAIIEGDQAQLGRSLSKLEIEQIDSYTLEAFYEGLPPEYRTEVRLEGYCNLTEAYSKAILVNKRFERDRARQRDTRSVPARNPVINPERRETPQIAIMQPNRQSFPNNRTNNVSPQTSAVDSSFRSKICSYCKKVGHLISECRKRQYNSNRQNNQENLPGPSASGATQGQANARPIYPIITEVLESPPSSSQPE